MSSKEILELFWTLGDLDGEKRQETSDTLLTHLTESKGQPIFERDLEYVLKRLLGGLCSSNAASRQGYGATLTQLLRENRDAIKTQEFFDQLKEKTKTTGSMTGMDLRDLLFGRLTGYAVLERSGRFSKVDKCDDEEKQVLTDIMAQIVEDCCKIAEKRKWLAELCNEITCSIIEQTKAKGSVFAALVNRIPAFPHVELSSFSPHELALCLCLQRHSKSDLKRLKPLSKLLKKPLLRSGNFSDLKEPLLAATRTFPRLHTVWVNIIVELHSDLGKLEEFWKEVVEETFAFSTNERKCTSFHLFLEISRMLCATGNPEIVQRFLTPHFLRCIVNQCSNKDGYLHTQAKATLKNLSKWLVEWEPKFGFGYEHLLTEVLDQADLEMRFERGRIGVIHALLTNGDRAFDRRTNTKTIANLLSHAGNALDMHLSILRDQIVATSSNDQGRKWAITEFAGSVKVLNRDVQGDAARLQVALTLMCLAFFKATEETADRTKSTKKIARETLCGIESEDVQALGTAKLSEELRDLCEQRFYTVIADYFSDAGAKKANAEEGKPSESTPAKRALAQAKEKTERAMKVLELWHGLESRGFVLLKEVSEEEEDARKVALSLIKKSDADKTPVLFSIQVLLVNLLIQSLRTDDGPVVIDLVELVEDLKQCFERLSAKESQEKSTPSKKKKKTKSVSNDEDEVAVIVDIMISLVAQPSAMLRDVVNTSFKLVCANITPQAIDALVSVLVTRSTVRPGAQDGEKEEEDDEALLELEESEGDEDEEMAPKQDAAKDEEEDSDSSSDEEELDGDVDPEAAKLLGTDGVKGIKSALFDNAPESDAEMDVDEDMDKYDNALMAYIRARNEEKKKRSKSHAVHLTKENVSFKLRVLDLLEVFRTVSPTNPLLLLLPVPMQQAAARCLKKNSSFIAGDSVGLFNRLISFQNKILKKNNKGNIAARAIIIDQSLTIAEPFVSLDLADSDDEDTALPPGQVKLSVGDQLQAILEQSVAAASRAGSPELSKACTAAVYFVFRLAGRMETDRRHLGAVARVREATAKAYGRALESWLTKKGKIGLKFFSELFEKQPNFGCLIVPKLCELSIEEEGTCTADSKISSAFCRCEALQLMEVALKFAPREQGMSNSIDVGARLRSLIQVLRALNSNLHVAIADQRASAELEKQSGDELELKVGLSKVDRWKRVLSCGVKACQYLKLPLTELLNKGEQVELKKTLQGTQSALALGKEDQVPKLVALGTKMGELVANALEKLADVTDDEKEEQDAPAVSTPKPVKSKKSKSANTTGKKAKRKESPAAKSVSQDSAKKQSKKKRRKSTA